MILDVEKLSPNIDETALWLPQCAKIKKNPSKYIKSKY